MTCERTNPSDSSGFTLVEVLVVLAVLSTLGGMAVPLVHATIDARRAGEVEAELESIGAALERHYFANGSFPTTLRDPDFYAVDLQPGVRGTAILDGWNDAGGDADYVYSVATNPDRATVYSRGPNGTDDGVLNEEFTLVVHGAIPGALRTRMRMRLIIEALADFIEGGGTLTGDWTTDRAALGLGSTYQTDGFGTDFVLDPSTMVLRSAGPDRVAGNTDDLTS